MSNLVPKNISIFTHLLYNTHNDVFRIILISVPITNYVSSEFLHSPFLSLKCIPLRVYRILGSNVT